MASVDDIEHSSVISPDIKRGEALRLCKSTTDIDVVIALSKHNDAQVRKAALKEMCPCRVKVDIEEFWERVLAMVDDTDDDVRQQVREQPVTFLLQNRGQVRLQQLSIV